MHYNSVFDSENTLRANWRKCT